MAPTPKQNAKPVFKTSSPFTETKWPQTSHSDQEVILDLICNLIAPLGDHRRTHTHPSKGKKRKRSKKNGQDNTTTEAAPPLPEIGKHLLVGLNSVTRHLEALAARNAPSATPAAAVQSGSETKAPEQEKNEGDARKEKHVLRPLSMVILTHPKPSLSPAHAHLPTLVHLSTLPLSTTTPSPSTTSTLSPPLDPATRLILLPTSTDGRLASNLHIPRVGALAIFEGAPGAKALAQFVRENVGVTECAWVDEAMKAQWKGVNVKMEMASGKK